MKIRTQLIAGIVVFALLIIVIFALVLNTNQQVDRLIAQENTANSIALDVGELGYLSNDYILYRTPEQESEWTMKFAAVSGDIANISIDQPGQQLLVGNLASDLKATQSVFDNIESSPVRISNPEEYSYVQISESRMAVQNQEMIFDADQLASLFQTEADSLKMARTLLIFVLMGTFGALLLSVYFFYYRRTLKSIADLQEGARMIGTGNLDHEIVVKGDDEISDLSRSFNQMTSELKKVIATKSDLEREIAGREQAELDLRKKNEALNELNEELTAAQEELNRNLGELKQADKILRRQADLLRQSYDAIIVWRLGGAIESWNRGAELLYGYTEEEALGRITHTILATIHPKPWDQIEKELREKGLWEGELLHHTKDGREIVVNTRHQLIHESDGTDVVLETNRDITERKTMEEILQNTLGRFYQILSNMHYGILLVTDEGQVEFANSGFCDMFGLNESATNLRGISDTEMIEKIRDMYDNPDKAVKRIKEIVRLGQPVLGEEVTFQDERVMLRDYVPIFIGGKLFERLWIHRDITDRKKVEEALWESEKRYRTLFNTMAEGFSIDEIIFDETGKPIDLRYLSVNPAFERINNLKAEDVVGRTTRELFPHAEPVWFERYGNVVLTGESYHFEERFGPLDKWYDVRAYKTGPKEFAVIFFDITENKQAEKALRESKERFRSVLDNSRDLIYRENLQTGRYEYISPSAETVTGFSSDEFLAMDAKMARSMIHPDDISAMRSALESLESTGKGEVEYRWQMKNGNYRWFSNHMALFRDASGRPLYRDGSIRDITDHKLAEENLKEALSEKEVLLSEIHHRVKNNLTAFISLLSLDSSYEDTESGRALRNDLQNRARSMALIHETLYRTGKFSNVDMSIYLKNLVDQIAQSYGIRSDINVFVDVDGTLSIDRATTAGLIINELVTNSFKYAFPPEFDCMAVRGVPCSIRVSFAKEDGMDVLRVSDNGCGFREGFDPLKSKSLGLKLVNFLARHQLIAEIEVHSDKGTEFIFRLKNTERGR